MKRKILGYIICMFLLGISIGIPVKAAGTMSSTQWKKSPTGSAGVLEGKSVIVNIFVEDKESKWSEKDKKSVNRKLVASGKFMGKQAKRYGKKAKVVTDIRTHTSLCYTYKTKMKITDKEKHLDKLYRKVCHYIETKIPLDDIRREYGTDSVGFVIHMNKSGVSSTVVHYMGEQANFYECAMIFRKFHGEEESASTYAHEMLHLFAARDLYAESLEDGITFPFVKYVAKKFSNDIMFSTYTMSGKQLRYRITNEVSRVTAYYLGWKKKIPELKKYALMRGSKRGCFSDGTSY